jgi:hypothetical protein
MHRFALRSQKIDEAEREERSLAQAGLLAPSRKRERLYGPLQEHGVRQRWQFSMRDGHRRELLASQRG